MLPNSTIANASPPVAIERFAVKAVSAWGNVALAALLMLATLPGRTQGLGLITEPLLKAIVFCSGLAAWRTNLIPVASQSTCQL